MLKDKRWWRAAGIRALKTVAQNLASMLPVGLVITPVMVKEADWTVVYVIVAWLATGMLSGVASLLTSLGGLPELEVEHE